jgi:membrane protease YdiL (CAAX protease family)
MNSRGGGERLPNLAHFAIFLALTFFALAAAESTLLVLTHGTPVAQTLQDQRLQTLVSVSTYGLSLGLAYITFPTFWQRPFLVGMEWNAAAVKGWMLGLGLVLGFAAQGVDLFLPHPKDLPIEAYFRDPKAIWVLAFFGVVMGPLFEEVVFRGFLLPGIAIAVDYLNIPRSADRQESYENLLAWRAGEGYSSMALGLASIVTTALFVAIHGPQLAWTPSALGLLAVVSLVLCAVRLRTRSVAASAVVHACYNLSVFVTLFVGTGGFRHLDKL